MRYTKVFEGEKHLRPMGEPAVFRFSESDPERKTFRLFVTGETGLFYQWKDEPDMPTHYHTVTDALDRVHAMRDRFCLDLSSQRPEAFTRRVYKKVAWPPVLSYLDMHPVVPDWEAGFFVRTEGLTFAEGGSLRMRVEFFRLTEGIPRMSRENPLLTTLILPVEEGTYGWRRLSEAVTVDPEEVAHVGVWIEGKGYEGRVWVESPFLTASSGENLLPCFDVPAPGKEKFDWTAQYLSQKERPQFRVTLNGETVFEGERFERCHRSSEWEIALPPLKKENELSVALITECHDPLPYTVTELGILTEEAGAVTVAAVSEIASVEKGAYLLICTEQENTPVSVECMGEVTEKLCAEAGLHGIRFACPGVGENVPFTLRAGEGILEGVVPRVAERPEDRVFTGTGDMIYVEQDEENIEEYLAWYVSEGIGNLLTIRPTYRWSGTRVLQPEAWKLFTRVMNELGMVYPLMLDGRELPGENCNPDDGMLEGPGYFGRQLHEFDGAAYYWGLDRKTATPWTEQMWDMEKEIFREDPDHTAPGHSVDCEVYNGNELVLYRNLSAKRDYKAGHDDAVKFLEGIRHGAPRHTGPAVLFSTFYEAGFRWVGAETMYGSLEPIMAFERGTAAAYGSRDIGVHHAVQWSSSPQDAPEHYRRYRLALYVSWMLGATEINTEEGLWHMEEYYSHFHRYSECCVSHKKQQTDFYRWVASHARTGCFTAPAALIQGRYDGWHNFGNRQVWGWADGENGPAEKSWQILKGIWPLSAPGEALYCHGCDTAKEPGYYSGTPLGQADVLPFDKGSALFSNYRVLIFAGYHAALPGDGEKLAAYARQGGRVLMTAAHMSRETDYSRVFAEEFSFDFDPGSTEAMVGGLPVRVARNLPEGGDVLERTDEGLPLVVRFPMEKGEVTVVTALAYPGNPAILPLYTRLVSRFVREAEETEPVWAEAGEDVGFSVYRQEDGSAHVYLLAVDWYHPEAGLRRAAIRTGGFTYEVSLPFGIMTKCVAREGITVWGHSEEADVLRLEEGFALLQGTGVQTYTICVDGVCRTETVDFAGKGIARIRL